MSTVFEPARITGRIWQGGYIGRPEAEVLARAGATHVLNLDFPFDRTLADLTGIDLRILEMLVHDMAPLSEQDARRIVAAIHRAMAIERGTIYVHCNAGLSRSPTAVWLYLVSTGWSRDRASDAVAAAAPHLSAPDPVLVSAIDPDGLAAWSREPRWELWRRHPRRQGEELLGTFAEVAGARDEERRQIERYAAAAGRAGEPDPALWHRILAVSR